MTTLQQAWLAKADRALASARRALDADDADVCLNRAYYAAFYVAQAALAAEGEQPRTHSGTISRFSFHFVRTGRLAREVGAFLHDAFDLRQQADYDAIAVTDTRAAADALADAETFVAAVRPLVATPD